MADPESETKKADKKQKSKDQRKQEKMEKKEEKREKHEHKGKDGAAKKEKKEDKYRREKEKRFEKKRKREEEEEEEEEEEASSAEPAHPSKKTSLEFHAEDQESEASHSDTPQMQETDSVQEITKNVTFKLVEDVGEWSPAIVFTPGLDPKIKGQFDAYSKPRQQPANRADRTPWTQELLLHNDEHSTLDYVAREEPSAGVQSHLRDYLGIYDPATGECQVIPARRLILRSSLKSARGDQEEELQDDEDQNLTSIEKRTALQQAFGTKKSQKAVRSMQENSINTPLGAEKDADGKITLDATAAAVIDAMDATSMPSKKALQAETDASKPIPKPNLEAKSPSEVYPIEVLVDRDTLKHIDVSQWENSIRDKVKVDVHSRFVANRISNIVKQKDTTKVKALKYLLALVQWKKNLGKDKKGRLQLPRKGDDSKGMLKGVEPLLVDKIKRKFAPDGQLDSWHADYLMTHICALGLVLDEFETDVCDLREDLALELKDVTKYYLELGCKVKALPEGMRDRQKLTKATAATHHRLAKLVLPLVFPKAKVPPRSRN